MYIRTPDLTYNQRASIYGDQCFRYSLRFFLGTEISMKLTSLRGDQVHDMIKGHVLYDGFSPSPNTFCQGNFCSTTCQPERRRRNNVGP